MTAHLPGTFCWSELGSSDAGAACRFYTALFGWTVESVPMGPGGLYHVFSLRGLDVAAAYQLDPVKQAGVRSHWLPYVSVASADAAADTATLLGGSVVMPPFDVPDAGRMALLRDPTGAVLAAWQARSRIGAELIDEPGAVSWNELATTDVQRAGDFYAGLFTWGRELQEFGGTPYTSFTRQGTPVGGMMQMTAERGAAPPHWLVYFSVEDCDASATLAASLGATVRVPPTDVPGIGRFATIADGQGAVCSIIALASED